MTRVLAAISWLDALKLGAALIAPLALSVRAVHKISKTMTAILEVTKRLPIVENDVHLLKVDSVTKHTQNTQRLDQLDAKADANTDRLNLLDIKADAISAQVAGQKSTGEMMAEVLGEPLEKIARVLTGTPRPLQPPQEGTT